VLGIIFLRFADNKYALAEEVIQAELELTAALHDRYLHL